MTQDIPEADRRYILTIDGKPLSKLGTFEAPPHEMSNDDAVFAALVARHWWADSVDDMHNVEAIAVRCK